ncbi:MAG: glycosyltransferase, partial [Nitrososphaerota archaeon]|nr:glycosyltransferase [Nitrososphaerota archaeon]
LALERRVARVRLTVRAKVPECVRARYALDSRKNITVVDSPVNPNELGDIFSGADIFLYPTHEAQNFVVLDAMSYGLPVVTTQIGSSGRIANGHNGFVLRALPPLFGFRAQRARGYHLPYETIPISQITSEVYDESAVLKAIQSYKNQIIDEIIETSLKLIDNPKLRLTAGEKGRAAVTTGIHSIEERNRKLKSILDNATAGTG